MKQYYCNRCYHQYYTLQGFEEHNRAFHNIIFSESTLDFNSSPDLLSNNTSDAVPDSTGFSGFDGGDSGGAGASSDF
jgi:hypothetical protein